MAINSKALECPSFIDDAVNKFGSSTIVCNIEAKKIEGPSSTWEPYKFCGRERTNINLSEWIKIIHQKNCGEILLTSIDKEGTETGFDIELIDHVYKTINKPLIISGGCGSIDDIKDLKKKFSNMSVALASVLHYDKIKIKDIIDNLNK